MATTTVPSFAASHAAALARILHVTRQAWALDACPHKTVHAPAATQPPSLSRRARLARAAARAFEAQVMAMRCRQVVVA